MEMSQVKSAKRYAMKKSEQAGLFIATNITIDKNKL